MAKNVQRWRQNLEFQDIINCSTNLLGTEIHITQLLITYSRQACTYEDKHSKKLSTDSGGRVILELRQYKNDSIKSKTPQHYYNTFHQNLIFFFFFWNIGNCCKMRNISFLQMTHISSDERWGDKTRKTAQNSLSPVLLQSIPEGF